MKAKSKDFSRTFVCYRLHSNAQIKAGRGNEYGEEELTVFVSWDETEKVLYQQFEKGDRDDLDWKK